MHAFDYVNCFVQKIRFSSCLIFPVKKYSDNTDVLDLKLVVRFLSLSHTVIKVNGGHKKSSPLRKKLWYVSNIICTENCCIKLGKNAKFTFTFCSQTFVYTVDINTSPISKQFHMNVNTEYLHRGNWHQCVDRCLHHRLHHIP